MPRQFFRRVSADYRRKGRPAPAYLRPFQAALEHPAYLAVNRRSVSGAVALGLFVGLLPIPGHMLLVVVAALLLRVNLPVAFLMIWLSNPLTFGPILYAEYKLGTLLLGLPPRQFAFDFSWAGVTGGLNGVWQPLWVGALVGGALVAGVGYLSVSVLWRWSTANRLRRRPVTAGGGRSGNGQRH